MSGLFLDSWGTCQKTRVHRNPSSHSQIPRNARLMVVKGMVIVSYSPEERRYRDTSRIILATNDELHSLKQHRENGSFSWVCTPFSGPFPPHLG